MKKKLSGLLILGLFTLLSACGGGSSSGNGPGEVGLFESRWSDQIVTTCSVSGFTTNIDEPLQYSIIEDSSGTFRLWVGDSSVILTVSGSNASTSETLSITGTSYSVNVTDISIALSEDNSSISGTFNYSVDANGLTGLCPGSLSLASSRVTPSTAPAEPTGLTVVNPTDRSLELNWTTEASGEAVGYIIKRMGPADSDYVEIARVGNGAAAYIDGSLNSKSTYYYQVISFNSVGQSAAALALDTTLPPPPT